MPKTELCVNLSGEIAKNTGLENVLGTAMSWRYIMLILKELATFIPIEVVRCDSSELIQYNPT